MSITMTPVSKLFPFSPDPAEKRFFYNFSLIATGDGSGGVIDYADVMPNGIQQGDRLIIKWADFYQNQATTLTAYWYITANHWTGLIGGGSIPLLLGHCASGEWLTAGTMYFPKGDGTLRTKLSLPHDLGYCLTDTPTIIGSFDNNSTGKAYRFTAGGILIKATR